MWSGRAFQVAGPACENARYAAGDHLLRVTYQGTAAQIRYNVECSVRSTGGKVCRLRLPGHVSGVQVVWNEAPEFLAIHCQEVGGKNYEDTMQHVNKFVK